VIGVRTLMATENSPMTSQSDLSVRLLGRRGLFLLQSLYSHQCDTFRQFPCLTQAASKNDFKMQFKTGVLNRIVDK